MKEEIDEKWSERSWEQNITFGNLEIGIDIRTHIFYDAYFEKRGGIVVVIVVIIACIIVCLLILGGIRIGRDGFIIAACFLILPRFTLRGFRLGWWRLWLLRNCWWSGCSLLVLLLRRRSWGARKVCVERSDVLAKTSFDRIRMGKHLVLSYGFSFRVQFRKILFACQKEWKKEMESNLLGTKGREVGFILARTIRTI